MLHKLFAFFCNQPFQIQLSMVLMTMALILALLVFTFGAAVWSFVIVPHIESRIGEKLHISVLTDMYLFGRFFFFQMELSVFILRKYVLLKLGKDPDKRRLNKYAFALANVNYDIEQATCLEIFMAFYTPISCLLVFLCVMLSGYLLITS